MRRAQPLVVTDLQRQILTRWVRKTSTTSHRLYRRAQIILWSVEGVRNVEQARRLQLQRHTINKWQKRWRAAFEGLKEAEDAGASTVDLTDTIRVLLTDKQRSGGPTTFTAEQLALIIALACEQPEDPGLPVTHWTPRELAQEAIRRGIVATISPRHVDRILKKGRSDLIKAGTG